MPKKKTLQSNNYQRGKFTKFYLTIFPSSFIKLIAKRILHSASCVEDKKISGSLTETISPSLSAELEISRGSL